MYTVLIVDDERYIREGLRQFIDWRSEGFRIIGESGDGADALRQIRELEPDVVLCDIRMPNMDGLALVEHASRELDEHPWFIILSGYDDFSYAQRALQLGVSNYLLKPVQRDELLAELHRVRELRGRSGTDATNVVSAPAVDLVLRPPSAKRLAEALGLSEATVSGAETCAFRFVATEYSSPEDVARLMHGVEGWFVCNGLSLVRRTHATVLEGIHVRGHSFRGSTLRDFERGVLELCDSLDVRVRVFRGPLVSGIVRARESVDGLDAAVHDAFYTNDPFTYHWDPSGEYGFDSRCIARIQALGQCISSLSVESLDRDIGEIDATLRKNPVQPDTVLGAVSALLVDVWTIVADREGSVEEFEIETGGAPHIEVSLGLDGVLARVRSYGRTAIAYLKSIHSDTRNQVVRDVELYVGRHLDERLRVKDIAGHLGLHPYYLGRLFKEQTGVTLTDYVHRARIEAAKEMLVTRRAALSDIASWVGYGDAEYFSRKFKEIVGVSPRDYREQRT
ncbi:MAG: response regulator transcription factor [Spirochaetota bacterium]